MSKEEHRFFSLNGVTFDKQGESESEALMDSSFAGSELDSVGGLPFPFAVDKEEGDDGETMNGKRKVFELGKMSMDKVRDMLEQLRPLVVDRGRKNVPRAKGTGCARATTATTRAPDHNGR